MRYSVDMQAKKSLGQHFLKSKKALAQIRDAADITANDLVLEIGPGTGILTEILLIFAAKVIAIEKDRELIPILQEKFSYAIAHNKLEIIEKDILKFDPEILSFYKDHPYKLVANIPYYITGAIIEKFLSTQYQPELMVLLMQREVAERIVARDGKHSILSIAVQVYGKPTIVGRVPPGAFVPPPTVESAILLIDTINRAFFSDCDEKIFFGVLKAVFGKKRKQIGGSLSDYIGSRETALSILQSVPIDPKARPEDMHLNDWKRLTQSIQNSVQL